MDGLPESVWQEPGWLVAIGALLLLVFRDVLIRAISASGSAIWNVLYQRLAGSWLLRRRALSQYRQGLIETTERIAVPFRPNRPLILSDIYVALKVTGAEGQDSSDVWDLLARHPRMVVTGGPGAGKSMLLRHLAATRVRWAGRAMNRAPLPVLLELHRLVRDADTGSSIEAHLVDAFERFGFPRASKFIDTALEKGRLVLLLDGLDEVPTAKRPDIARRIEDFLARNRTCPAIVTCRTAVYRGEFNSVTDQIVELEPFQDRQIQAFLGSWSESMPAGKSPGQLMAALREQPKLLAAARNPLLLTIVAHLYSDNLNYALPSSRAEFYSQAAAILLDQWQGHLGQNEFERSEKSAILSEFALAMQENTTDSDRDRRTISREDAFARATAAMPNLGRKEEDVWPIMREIVERSGLLLSIDGGSRYAFAHLTFQEYFAADALLNHPESLIRSFSGDPDTWREVVVLWCGLVADSTAMIEKIREANSEVALACVAEARSVHQDVAGSVLDPIVARVVSGEANETTQRGLGSVAADIRPRGEAVLDSLIDALNGTPIPKARASIATALSASNRLRAAEALVETLRVDSRLVAPIVRLGDLAVPNLASRARHDDDPELCRCLASIATPGAALALIEIMLEGAELETPAAWGVAKVIGNPTVVADVDLPVILDSMRRSHESLDWIWEPFEEEGGSSLSWIAGRAAALIRLTRDEKLAIAVPDARISAALCAMEPNPLDTPVTSRPAMPRLVSSATAAADETKFHYGSDGHIDAQLSSSMPWSAVAGDPRPRRRSGRQIADIATYRQLLALVVASRSRLVEPVDEDEYAKRMEDFGEALIDAIDHERIWARLMRGLHPKLRVDLLTRLTESTKVNGDTWPAVRGQVPFQCGRSRRYAAVLTIVFSLSMIALVYGVVDVAGRFDFPASLLAMVACLSIVASWIWTRAVTDFRAGAYGGVEPLGLAQAVLGFVTAPVLVSIGRNEERRPQRLPMVLVTMGFLPGTYWLSVGALGQAIPVPIAALLVGVLLAGCLATVIMGIRREWELETPLLGLFLHYGEQGWLEQQQPVPA